MSNYAPRHSRLGRRTSAYAAPRSGDGRVGRLGAESYSPPLAATSRRRRSFAGTTRSTIDSPLSDDSEDTGGIKQESRSPSPSQFALLSPRRDLSPSMQDVKPLAYASLPPSPISPSPLSPSPAETKFPYSASSQDLPYQPPFSIWDYLREELLATDFDSHQELKWERVSNFLSIPLAVEKILSFGFILCFDSFLHTFTILPIRFFLAVFRLVTLSIRKAPTRLPSSQKADILRTLLLVLSITILKPLADASKIYHSIRGQDTIKLYVIYNALEIADRLCTSFGQDILDCLFSRSTMLLLSCRIPISSSTLRPIFFFFLATLYTVSHALVHLYEMTALNVAINSYDYTLLTLLLSNQFVEIKGSVFKKFEKDNLFQITCADIVERFTMSLMLVAIASRNMVELSGFVFDLSEGVVLPKSFGWFKGGNLIWTILYPVLTVLATEVAVDWLKHAFITKFNHIRPSVYERFTDVLCLDLASGSGVGRRGARKHTYVDQSPLVARRLGFPALPLAVLAALMVSQSVGLIMSNDSASSISLSATYVATLEWIALGILFWVCFVVIKVIIGVNLVSYATRRRTDMQAREEEDKINDFGRDPIGEGKEEQRYNRELKAWLDNELDDATLTAEIGEQVSNRDTKVNGDNDKRRRPKLEELTRFTMVKRIW